MSEIVKLNSNEYKRLPRGARHGGNTENFRLCEGLPLFMQTFPVWNKYFDRIVNHNQVPLLERSMFIYCHFEQQVETRIVESISLIYRDNEGNSTRRWCRDMNKTSLRMTHDEEALPGIAIMVNEMLQGIFFPTIKTLFTADLTHFSEEAEDSYELIAEQFSILNDILIRLKDAGYITTERTEEKKERKWPVIKYVPDRIKIGADPEAECLVGGRVVSAIDHLRNYVSGNNEVGWDGASNTMEIRPKANADIDKVIENIRNCYQRVFSYNAAVSLAGSQLSIGGHIHVGSPLNPNEDPFLIKVFDELVGIPTFCLNSRCRLNSQYAGLGYARQQPHGIEYRVPPAQVFYHPELLQLIFKMMRTATLKYMDGDDIPLYVSFANNARGMGQTVRLNTIPDYDKAINKVNLINWGGLTEEETDKYYTLIKKFTPDVESFIAAWKINAKYKTDIKISIEFSDDWDGRVRNYFRDEINKELEKQNYKPKINDKILIYGLSKERGNVVAGIKAKGFRQIPHPKFGCEIEKIGPMIMKEIKKKIAEGGKAIDLNTVLQQIQRSHNTLTAKMQKQKEILLITNGESPAYAKEKQKYERIYRQRHDMSMLHQSMGRFMHMYVRQFGGPLMTVNGMDLHYLKERADDYAKKLMQQEGISSAYGIPYKVRSQSIDNMTHELVGIIVKQIIKDGGVQCAS